MKSVPSSFKKALSVICPVLLAAYFICFCIINFVGFERFCTADMYCDTYISKLIWEQKTIFPEGWVFGNQYYVVATPVLAALIYGLCGSVNLATAIAATIHTILIILSFLWMVWPQKEKSSLLIGTLVLIGSVIGPNIVTQIEGQIFYLMASYYSCYLITLFVVFGCYVRVLTGRKVHPLLYLTGLGLSFCTGMQSLRQTAVMILPLLCVEGLRLLRHWLRERRFPLPAQKRPFLCACAFTAANLLGCAAIRLFGPAQVTIFGEMTWNDAEQMLENLNTNFRALRGVSGLKYLFEDEPALGIIGLLMIAVVVIALICWLRAPKERAKPEGILFALLAASLILVLGINLVLNLSLRTIYLFMWYPLTAVSVMLLFERLGPKSRSVCAAVIVLAMAVNLNLSYQPCVETALSGSATGKSRIAEFLMDEGYTRLYGRWWQVCTITPYTDGKIDAGCWEDTVCQALDYINPLNIYTDEDNAKAAYLVTDLEAEAFQARCREVGATVERIASYDDGSIMLYRSDRQLMYLPE